MEHKLEVIPPPEDETLQEQTPPAPTSPPSTLQISAQTAAEAAPSGPPAPVHRASVSFGRRSSTRATFLDAARMSMVDSSTVPVNQLLIQVETRLSRQLSDVDRKLDIVAGDMNTNLTQLAVTLQKVSEAKMFGGFSGPASQHTAPMVPATGNGEIADVTAAGEPLAVAPWVSSANSTKALSEAGGEKDKERESAGDGCASGPPMVGRTSTLRQFFQVRKSAANQSGVSVGTSSSGTGVAGLGLGPRLRRVTSVARQVWTFLEDPDSSAAAWWYSRMWSPFIVASVALSVLQTTDPPVLTGLVPRILEVIFDFCYMLEVLVRYAVAPTSCMFLSSPHNVIDLFAALPLIFRAKCLALDRSCQNDTDAAGVVLNFTPTIRLLKTMRHFKLFSLFIKLMKETREALSVLLFTLCIIVLASSSLIYLVEPRENIPSLPKAMYLMIVTISTVGYGDVTPESTSGSMIVTATIVCSVLYTAMPIGIIGNAFTQIWTDRDRILLTERTRERLKQWGYTAKDMEMVFGKFDKNRSGELTLPEFRKMIAEMSIGIQGKDQDERVVQLFEAFDRDGSGGIDQKELTRALFPGTYHELYARRQENQAYPFSSLLHFQMPGLSSGRTLSRRNSMINEEDENYDEGTEGSNYCRLPMPRLGGRRTSLTRSQTGDLSEEIDSRQESPSSGFWRINFGLGARSPPRKRRSSISILQKHSSSLRSSKNTLEGTDSQSHALDGYNLQSSESDRSINSKGVARKGSIVSTRSQASKTSRTSRKGAHARKGQGQSAQPTTSGSSTIATTAGSSTTQMPPPALPAGQPPSATAQAKEDGPEFPPLFSVVC